MTQQMSFVLSLQNASACVQILGWYLISKKARESFKVARSDASWVEEGSFDSPALYVRAVRSGCLSSDPSTT